MPFPDRTYADAAAFTDAYFERLALAVASIDRRAVQAAADLLEAAYQRGSTLFACGNGGSAAIANSFECDHAKLVQTDTDLKPRVQSLSSNMAMLTAIANDLSYADVFTYPLMTIARPGDVLLTISASGDSENVVRAATWARENNMEVIAFTGFQGGRTAGLAHVHLHVEADNYGLIEDAHQSLMHILAQHIRLKRMPGELVGQRKF